MPTVSDLPRVPAGESTAGWAPLVLAALIGLLVGDALRPPARQAGARVALVAIDAYRATISRTFSRAGLVVCRFHPSCSVYGREAIARYGLPRGGFMAAVRVLRCNPFSKGGTDPVP